MRLFYYLSPVLLLAAQTSFAVAMVTSDNDWNRVIHPREHFPELSQYYSDTKNILILSDAVDSKDHLSYSIGKLIAPTRSTIGGQLVHTDILYPKEISGVPNDRLVPWHVDNTKPFPFNDNQFDTIVCRYGLCFCLDPQVSCGGLNFISESGENFFQEVVRVLNKEKRGSLAALHGGEFNYRSKLNLEDQNAQIEGIRQILIRLEDQEPTLTFELVYRNTARGSKLDGVKITTMPTQD